MLFPCQSQFELMFGVWRVLILETTLQLRSLFLKVVSGTAPLKSSTVLFPIKAVNVGNQRAVERQERESDALNFKL